MGWWEPIAGWLHRRKLRQELQRAKAELGLHGWQAAHFPPELDATIDYLRQVEEVQVELLNHHAGLAHDLEKLDQEAEQARSLYDASCQDIDHRLGHATQRGPEATQELREASDREKAFRRAVSELDDRIKKLEESRQALLRDQTPGIDGKLRSLLVQANELRSERQTVDQQRRIWSAKRVQTEAEYEATQTATQRGEKERRRAQRKLMANLAKIRRERARAFSQKSGSDNEFKRIERLKMGAYAELGEALANSNIAPPNQPELLDIVLELRELLHEKTGEMKADRFL